MIEEDYCSFEVAKLLKEKGFDEPCDFIYEKGELTWFFDVFIYSGILTNSELGDEFISAPTPQMIMKYLRVMYNIFISIDIYSKDFEGNIRYCADIYEHGSRMILDTPIICDTFEETCDESIKYVLENLI